MNKYEWLKNEFRKKWEGFGNEINFRCVSD
nr:MAG TPA: hypothetical protein [Caudoviricetes sp.]